MRTYADSYQPPYRSERVTRSAYYNLKTGEQVSLEDSLVRHGLSFDTLKSETKQVIKTAKPNIDSVSEGNIDDDDNYTGHHFYYDGKGYIVVPRYWRSLTAWHGIRTTWLRTPSTRAIPAVRDVTPERARPRTCPTSRVKSQEVNCKVPGGARRSDAGDFMMQIGSETSRLGQPRARKAPIYYVCPGCTGHGGVFNNAARRLPAVLLTQIWLWLAPLGLNVVDGRISCHTTQAGRY